MSCSHHTTGDFHRGAVGRFIREPHKEIRIKSAGRGKEHHLGITSDGQAFAQGLRAIA